MEIVIDGARAPAHEQSCDQCQWVANADSIAIPVEVRRKVMTARPFNFEDGILEIGYFTLPRWVGHNLFYAFRCPYCREFGWDYLHGHRLYLLCNHCGTQLMLRQRRFYLEAGTEPPPSWSRVLLELFRFWMTLGEEKRRGSSS